MSNAIVKEWFQRAHGEWSSNRRYWYAKGDRNEVLKSHLTVNFKDTGEDAFTVALTWDTKDNSSQVSEGEMLCEFDPYKSTLRRNIGYMTNDETASRVSMIDADTVLLNTEYSGMRFREEIRLIGEDIRLRQTVGWRDNKVILVGQYYETRV